MRTSFTVNACPVPAPRQSSRDRWAKRPAVERYRTWCDEVRLAATGSPMNRVEGDVLGIVCLFHLPVPESWPADRKNAAYGRMHRQTKDTDNLTKAVKDALFGEDKRVAMDLAFKFYVEEGEQPRADVFLLVP